MQQNYENRWLKYEADPKASVSVDDVWNTDSMHTVSPEYLFGMYMYI